jgi:hypothetical protein
METFVAHSKTPVDIKTLIQTSSIQIYDQNKLIDKLKEHFDDEEQRLYVSNLFLYLNYHPINDFVVNLENVWKFIGFSNKANGKRLLKQHFTENKDYQKLLIRSDEQVVNLKDGKNIGGAGLNQETIMLNVNTFKKLCLRANTSNSDKIHDYYIKLEMVYNELTKEELEENKQKLIEQQQRIELLEHKPNTHGFNSRRAGYVYMINDRSKPGHYKIGMSYDVDKRLSKLNTASSEATLGVFHEVKTYDCETLENTVHKILQPFNIPRRREWFFFSNNTELQYALQILHETQIFLNKFDFKTSDDVINYVTSNLNNNKQQSDQSQYNKQPQQESEQQTKEPEEQYTYHQENSITETNVYKLTGQSLKNKTGVYKGVFWCTEKSKWRAALKIHYKECFLGYFDTELEGAVVYNDYALYLNNTLKTSYKINDVPDYNPNPRDVLKENFENGMETNTSKYIGVSYDSNRKYYVVSIKYKSKTYHLGNNKDDVECAKLYNKQALYFNNTFGTNYKLNHILTYVTEAENIHENILQDKINKKSSKYYGITKCKSDKFRAILVYNKKQIHLGTFTNELDAAIAYNKRAQQLNHENGCKYKINQI